MLKQTLLHPEILGALGAAGHNSKILIADGNFPFSTRLGPRAEIVFLNLMPGVISCAQALQAVVSAVPVQDAAVMMPAKSGPYAMKKDPPVWSQFMGIFKENDIPLKLSRLDIPGFYAAACGDDVALTIATADTHWYSNILLTIGAVSQPQV